MLTTELFSPVIISSAGANLHAPDEWVDLESVRAVTRVLALSTMDWCGVT